jgi:four helix bundle protein
MTEDRWRKLEIWKSSDELAFKVYKLTTCFPSEEKYGLTAQLRRAVLSIPTNIVEGYSRKGDKELTHFLNISLGSLAETKYLLHFANRLGLLTDETFSDIAVECEQLGKKLWSFYQTVKKNT